MKCNVTQLEEKNEPVDFVLGNYFIELEPGNYQAEEASNISDTQPNLLRFSQADEIDCKIVDLAVGIDSHSLVSDFWTLFFYGSKTLEGLGASCVLIDPQKNKHFLSCRLEFECTNNTAEYEALVQGLRKAIELKVSNLKVFGDSKIIVKQIRNQIHYVSPHLKAYQNEVWDLLKCFNAFNIISIPRIKNTAADLLATSATRLVPTTGYDHQLASVRR